jgi:hypothetical protein
MPMVLLGVHRRARQFISSSFHDSSARILAEAERRRWAPRFIKCPHMGMCRYAPALLPCGTTRHDFLSHAPARASSRGGGADAVESRAQVPADAAAALHIMAFEAMHTVIAHAAQSSVQLVVQLIPHLLTRLDATLGADAADNGAHGAGDAAAKATLQRKNELQGQLCAALQVHTPFISCLSSYLCIISCLRISSRIPLSRSLGRSCDCEVAVAARSMTMRQVACVATAWALERRQFGILLHCSSRLWQVAVGACR